MRMRAIIPCAGFGTRMGMGVNKSKELLVDPSTGKPIIEYHLDLCVKYELEPLIILRQEKVDLIEYCDINKLDCIAVSHNREWPRTIFLSNERWYEGNILLLPDTKFEPTGILKHTKTDLEIGAELSLGVHQVMDPSKWCVVQNYTLNEKPNIANIQSWAFGIIGFSRGAGLKLFDDLDRSKKSVLSNRTSIQYLDMFKDITRTGIIG